ncbi:MAG: hypothetical protein C4570_04965 [Ammonifex sp.]|jgi:rubredoxin|nr:MAG: hypothetical protein C4570_04965 [Ammonifex sp.]
MYVCDYVYDPEAEDPGADIEAGTAFAELPGTTSLRTMV